MRIYFDGKFTFDQYEAANKEYKRLAKQLHPDAGGDQSTFQEMARQWRAWKKGYETQAQRQGSGEVGNWFNEMFRPGAARQARQKTAEEREAELRETEEEVERAFREGGIEERMKRGISREQAEDEWEKNKHHFGFGKPSTPTRTQKEREEFNRKRAEDTVKEVFMKSWLDTGMSQAEADELWEELKRQSNKTPEQKRADYQAWKEAVEIEEEVQNDIEHAKSVLYETTLMGFKVWGCDSEYFAEFDGLIDVKDIERMTEIGWVRDDNTGLWEVEL